jgi:hypothetical protein
VYEGNTPMPHGIYTEETTEARIGPSFFTKVAAWGKIFGE